MNFLYSSNPYVIEKYSLITERDTDHLSKTTPVTGEEAELKVRVDGLLKVSQPSRSHLEPLLYLPISG